MKDALIDEEEIKEKVEVLENIVEGYLAMDSNDPE